MALSEVQYRRLAGPERVIGVEAAAGAGKTHLACELASAWGRNVRSHQSVLFLSHTNAARDVFRRRFAGAASATGVEMKTLDSFCLEILSPYAALWDLPAPLRPPQTVPREWFPTIRRKAWRLLEAKGDIARAIVTRFPVILADEHQDASLHHHAMLMTLAESGAKIRMFGDGLQAILTFDATIPGWDALMADVPTIGLSGSWRWTCNPSLGEWIASARACLRAGRPISLREVPSSIHVVHTGRVSQWSRDPTVIRHLSDLADGDSVVVLGRRNDEVKEIARVPALRLVVNEGSDIAAAEGFIEEVLASVGDAALLAADLVDFMRGLGTLDEQAAAAIVGLDATTTNPVIRTIVRELDSHPNLWGVISATIAAKRGADLLGWGVVHPLALQTVATLPREATSDDVRDLMYQARRSASETAMPTRCASTIHKAKGREFTHVVLPSVDARTYGCSTEDRQLLYVALSRATERLTIMVPDAVSPLVDRD